MARPSEKPIRILIHVEQDDASGAIHIAALGHRLDIHRYDVQASLVEIEGIARSHELGVDEAIDGFSDVQRRIHPPMRDLVRL